MNLSRSRLRGYPKVRKLLTRMRRQTSNRSRSRRKRPIVLLVAAVVNASHRQIMSGVVEYIDRHAEWETIFFSSPDDYANFCRQSGQVRADGLLAAPTQPAHLTLLMDAGCPSVLMGFGAAGVPSVQADELAIGALACEHFIGLGIRQLAYCGLPDVAFAQQRLAGFMARAQTHALQVQVYPGPVYAEMLQHAHESRRFHKWLRSLPAGVGLFCPVSHLSLVVVHHCRDLDIVIPDGIAVLGVDDDEIICNLSHPQLSAIDQAPERIGFHAAAMLDRILAGKAPPREPVLIEPRGVVARGSTDLLMADNPNVAQAIRFIRSHIEDGINVGDVMKAVPMSRRGLERGFVRNIGRSIHDEIILSRIDRARHLLDTTDISLADVSERCGFTYPSKLSAVFKRVTGISPGHYRRRSLTHAPAGAT